MTQPTHGFALAGINNLLKIPLLTAFLGVLCAGSLTYAQPKSPPPWVTMKAETLPPAEAAAMEQTARKYYDLVLAGKFKEAAGLVAGGDLLTCMHTQLNPRLDPLIRLKWISKASPAGPGIAFVYDCATRRIRFGDENRTVAGFDLLRFWRSDPRHIQLCIGWAPDVQRLTFVPIWNPSALVRSLPGLSKFELDESEQARVVSFFSSKYPGWHKEVHATYLGIRQWAEGQAAKYGAPAAPTYGPSMTAGYVGIYRGDAVVEKQVRYTKPGGPSALVTYRFLLKHENTTIHPLDKAGNPGLRTVQQWLIADIRTAKVEPVGTQTGKLTTAGPADRVAALCRLWQGGHAEKMQEYFSQLRTGGQTAEGQGPGRLDYGSEDILPGQTEGGLAHRGRVRRRH